MCLQVFPREYKRALREMAEEEEGKKNMEVANGEINGGTDDNIEEEEATIEEVAEVINFCKSLTLIMSFRLHLVWTLMIQ